MGPFVVIVDQQSEYGRAEDSHVVRHVRVPKAIDAADAVDQVKEAAAAYVPGVEFHFVIPERDYGPYAAVAAGPDNAIQVEELDVVRSVWTGASYAKGR